MSIAVIRIRGQVKLRKDMAETLNRLRLKKKYSCVVLEETKENLGMVEKAKDLVAYGRIDEGTLKKLNDTRGGKIKNFFTLHPPRKGIDSKKHFGVNRGVLGNNHEGINKLIERML